MSSSVSNPQEMQVDLEAVRAKYRQEREKRLRQDANDQYIEVAGEFSYFQEDPYVDPNNIPEPITEEVDVAVIGGGFGGLLTAVEMVEAGVTNIRIIEKGADFGGTWYWNRYPGVACDMEAYIYLPVLEETGYIPKNRFAGGQEIMDHCRRIARHWNLYDKAKFQSEVSSMTWNDAASRWHIKTKAGDSIRARFVVMANGPMHRPKLPSIKGINSYKGHTFHTSRWDFDYTGGDSSGGLTKLKGKRVGIIGTGATAVQCIPHLAEHADHLYVFQRTPSAIDVRNDRPTDVDWFTSQQSGWQKHRMDNFNTLTTGGFAAEDLVNDGWTEIMRTVGAAMMAGRGDMSSMEKLMEFAESVDFQKMEQIRNRVAETVNDPETAEALKPYYRQFCKRPCFDDKYLETFNRPNVTLVDTKGQGIHEITARGPVYNGQEYDVDCLIFATGFEVGTDYTRRCGYDVVGRDGLKLSDKWAGGASTFHGMMTHKFPNCFIHQLSQGALAFNFVHGIIEYARHMAHIVKQAQERRLVTVEASEAAEREWVEQSMAASQFRLDFLESCTPGYYNNEGKSDPRLVKSAPFGAGPTVFFGILEAWRNQPEMPGLVLTPSTLSNRIRA